MNVCGTVQTVEDILRAVAPFETAEDFDNVGLLIGRRDRAVHKVLVALDATLDVVEEAKALGAELIVSHLRCSSMPVKIWWKRIARPGSCAKWCGGRWR